MKGTDGNYNSHQFFYFEKDLPISLSYSRAIDKLEKMVDKIA